MEMLSQSVQYVFPSRKVERAFVLFWPESRMDRLPDLGWCPYEARVVTKSKHLLTSLALYTNLERSQHNSSHVNCTKYECSQSQIADLHGSKPRHRKDCTDPACRAMRVDESMMDGVISIIENGHFPALKIHADLNGTATDFDIVQCEYDSDYIAISHVWSQGMGNEHDNAIYQCHMAHLYNKSRQLTKIICPDRDISLLPIYFDAICCPKTSRSNKNIKKLALQQMQDIYRSANAVFVLDTELEKLGPTFHITAGDCRSNFYINLDVASLDASRRRTAPGALVLLQGSHSQFRRAFLGSTRETTRKKYQGAFGRP